MEEFENLVPLETVTIQQLPDGCVVKCNAPPKDSHKGRKIYIGKGLYKQGDDIHNVLIRLTSSERKAFEQNPFQQKVGNKLIPLYKV